MNKNEMLPVNSYTALKDFNLAEAMNDELSGMDVSFDRVTIPAAGGTAFELPGELPGETEAAKEFSGITRCLPTTASASPAATAPRTAAATTA